MEIQKQYVGMKEMGSFQVQYFTVQKEDYYGIEVVKIQEDHQLSAIEYFTEFENEARILAQRLAEYDVTPMTLSNVIDDYKSR